MGIYDTVAGVERYVAMAEGIDGREHIAVLRELLADGSSVLELGMGPGKDLDILLESFAAVGSDNSQAFLDRYAANHPDADLRLLDAVSLEIEARFDAVYSNKVLHHLTIDELDASLLRQRDLVRPGGILLHTVWAGEGKENHEGLFVQLHTCETFCAAAPPDLELLECTPYAEFEPSDSLRIVLRRSSDR